MYDVASSETVKAGRFAIVCDKIEKDGNLHPFSYVKVRPGICVIPVMRDKVVVTYEYRHAIKQTQAQFTCGIIDVSETPEEAVMRELREEIGFIAEKIEYLGYDYPSVGSTDEKIALFVAYSSQYELEPPHRDTLEMMECELKDIAEVDEMISSNEMATGGNVIAWYKWRNRRKPQGELLEQGYPYTDFLI